ncbi:luc7-like protein 3 [Daphnia carinata]|uniref:luc7-like protein 3 n=1 Tax=Daphnia carinata TaxID=120202 RepID=UPI00257AD5C1|nr:luc7-like protein 3 [Daphnia carinata]
MASMAAQLLDELMGRNRNALPTDRTKELSYNDAEVCRYYMVRFCPHDLFHNTKADLGPCSNLHDEVVRQKYLNEAPSYTKTKFEDEFLKYCRSMLNEVERKIQKGEQRLAQSQLAKQEAGANPKSKAEEQIAMLTDKISHLVKEAERLGFEGNIEQAQGLLKLSDQFKSEREALKKGEGLSFATELMLEKQMEVCKVCGAFLIVGDAPARLDDHMQGKQHVGYQKLRSAVDEITESREKARQDREMQRQKEAEDRRGRRHDDDSRRQPGKDREGSSRRRSRSRSPRHRSSNHHGDRRDRSEKSDRHRGEHERHRDKDRGHTRDHRDRKRDDRPRDRDRSAHNGLKENGGGIM